MRRLILALALAAWAVVVVAPPSVAQSPPPTPCNPNSGAWYVAPATAKYWICSSDGSTWVEVTGSGGSGAPTDATYITQTANGTLTAEQVLSALATGLLKVTNGTGVLSTAVAPTDYVADSDSRLTNARTPTAHASSHQNAGSDEVATATAGANAIPKAGAGGTLAIGWIPLGSTSSTVAVGNDSRLSDARTPTAHASTHQNAGSDEVATATAGANAIPKAGAGGTLAIGWIPLGSTSSTVTVGNDARLSDARTPTAHASTHLSNGSDPIATATTTVRGTVELATDGESAASLVPQANDSRLSNARTPTAHASTHVSGQSDAIAAFTSTVSGLVPASGGGTTNFLRADGNFAAPPGGGSGPTTMRVSADQTSTSTAFANVTGLTASVSASTTYSYRCNLLWSSSATTEGGNFSVNGPSSSAIRIWRVVYTSATAHTSEATGTAFDAGTLLTAGPGSGIWPVELYGTFTVGGTGGTFAVRWRAETGGANSMTIKAGSFCQLY